MEKNVETVGNHIEKFGKKRKKMENMGKLGKMNFGNMLGEWGIYFWECKYNII
jgi:hypothetical protein